jgi:quercetin dioxygenase-like cupin family protein
MEHVMNRFLLTAGCLLTAAFGFIAVPSGAADQKQVYVSPGSERNPLFTGPLHGVETHHITVEEFTFPPGWVGGKHYHTGPVFVYILDGEFGVSEKGRAEQKFGSGVLYREPIGTPMQARNLSASRPLKVLLIQIGRKGEPLMIQTDY